MIYSGKLIESDGKRIAVFELDEDINQDEVIRFSPNNEYQAEIIFDDNRRLTSLQRKKAHALIADVARWSGDDPAYSKAWLKYYFVADTDNEYFSLSDCSVTTARLFINYLIEFAFKWNVPFKAKGMDVQDDIGKYLWLCIKYRKCTICGQHGEIHHLNAIGAGRDRKQIDHTQHDLICLCRDHHQEAHNLGIKTFKQRYMVAGIKLSSKDVKEFKI